MTDVKCWRNERLAWLATVILLPLAYMGAYGAMMVQCARAIPTPPGAPIEFGKPFPLYVRNASSVNAALEVFFAPANLVDRQMRREKWESATWVK